MSDPRPSYNAPDEPRRTRPSDPDRRPYAEEEISLLDILVVFARKKRLIVGSVIAFAVLGLAIAFTSSAEYTSDAKVVREAEDGQSGMPFGGGLSALQGLGIRLGGAASGLNPESYPDILRSREVRLAVVRDTFYVQELDRAMTYVDYVNREPGWTSHVWRYTVGLPGTLLDAMRGDEGPRAGDRVGTPGADERRALTEEEAGAIRAVENVLTTSIDRETGLMSISVTTGDPVLSAGLADSFSRHLTERVRSIRTKKSRDNLRFIEERMEEARADLREAEERLARFMDRNRNIGSESLRTERDRLRRQVNFAEQLYSDVQAQMTQAQIELQRSEPVLTVLEEPVVPSRPSGPRRTLIVLLSLILGGLVGIGAAFVATAVESSNNDAEEAGKLQEIKHAFWPQRFSENRNGEGDGATSPASPRGEAPTAER